MEAVVGLKPKITLIIKKYEKGNPVPYEIREITDEKEILKLTQSAEIGEYNATN